MKRSALKRKTPLRKRRGRSGKASRERYKLRRLKRYRDSVAGPYRGYDHGQFVRDAGCALHSDSRQCVGAVQAAHVRPRSRGGTWREQVGLCVLAHVEFDVHLANSPMRFESKHGIDLEQLAEHYALSAELRARENPGRWTTDTLRRCDELLEEEPS